MIRRESNSRPTAWKPDAQPTLPPMRVCLSLYLILSVIKQIDKSTIKISWKWRGGGNLVSIAFYSSGFNSIVDAVIAFIMAISDRICLGNYVWFLDASASIYTAFISFVYGARFENCLRPGIISCPFWLVVIIGECLWNQSFHPLVCLFFSTLTMYKTKALLYILEKKPRKTFGSGQSSIMIEHQTKNCAGLWPISTSRFPPLSAPLMFSEFHNHSPLLTMWSSTNMKTAFDRIAPPESMKSSSTMIRTLKKKKKEPILF